jgi:hypothetical protein
MSTIAIGPVHVGKSLEGPFVCADNCPHPDHADPVAIAAWASVCVLSSTGGTSMGEHDRMKITLREDDYGNEFYVAYCRCGQILVGATEEAAIERHRAHHRGRSVGLPGVAEARAALKGDTE